MNIPRSTGKHKIIIVLITVILLIVLTWFVNSYFSLVDLGRPGTTLPHLYCPESAARICCRYSLYMLLALVPGTGGKAIIWGWLFGFWQAMFIVTVGLTLAAMIIFSISRYLFQKSVERRYTRFLSLMNKHLEREGAFYLLTLRLAHAPFSIVNPVCGASRVRTWTFFWTTAVGLIPANAIWAYVGNRLPSLRELADHGAGSLIDPPLIGALVACALMPFLIRWFISHFGIPATETGVHDATIHESQEKSI